MTAARLALGAPGIYPLPDSPLRSLTGVRMDVCAFLGVAPRGPARVPLVDETWPDDVPTVEPERPRLRSVAVPVGSWDEYRRLFGGFEGPGLLPYAVASFFEQGGLQAYVVRIVHDYADPGEDSAGVATGVLEGVERAGGGAVELTARSEGVWGNRLRASASFRAQTLSFEPLASTLTALRLSPGASVVRGALLRITLASGAHVFRFVADVTVLFDPVSRRADTDATLDSSLTTAAVRVDTVEATLDLDDGAGQTERHEGLGLSAAHPRWMATVLCQASILVFPDPAWIEGDLLPRDLGLSAPDAADEPQFHGGLDRSHEIVPEDFFDATWVLGDEAPKSGVHCLVDLEDVSLVVAADLYSPRPLAPFGAAFDLPKNLDGPTFAPCVDLPAETPAQEPPPKDLDGLRLDPKSPGDLEKIIGFQSRLVDLAETLRSFVVLLDVPPELPHPKMLAWRARFASSFAASYCPWLKVSRTDDTRSSLIRINPSGVAAGIIAARELALGVSFGPANELARGVVDVEDVVSKARHDELHPAQLNVFLRERDGVRLTAARTLSRDAAVRQLSVRRLVTMLKRVLGRQMQWMVFEPNNAVLRSTVRQMLRAYLRQLYLANAFVGRTEDEAFFVRCDDELNPVQATLSGRLVCEVGVAPAEPLEFLVLRVARDGDGTLRVEG